MAPPAGRGERLPQRAYDFYVYSRYADVEAAHLDAHTYSSAHGTTLEMMTPEPYPPGQITFMDPPDHTRLPALVSRSFSPRRMAALEERIRAICATLLDAPRGTDSFDYVRDCGAILPPTLISSPLGVPETDQAEMRHTLDAVFHIEDGVGMINQTSQRALAAIDEYLADQIQDGRRHRRDDMLTEMALGEITGTTTPPGASKSEKPPTSARWPGCSRPSRPGAT